MNKKGASLLMGELFLLIASLAIAYFIVSLLLFGSGGCSRDPKLSHVADFNRIDSAINNIRVQLYEDGYLSDVSIDEQVANSKTISGKTITNCGDYWTKPYCDGDIVNLHTSNSKFECKWNDVNQKCDFNQKEVQSGYKG